MSPKPSKLQIALFLGFTRFFVCFNVYPELNLGHLTSFSIVILIQSFLSCGYLRCLIFLINATNMKSPRAHTGVYVHILCEYCHVLKHCVLNKRTFIARMFGVSRVVHKLVCIVLDTHRAVQFR